MRAKDAMWATLANASQQLFSFITMLVVARLLEPALFGVIATAMLLVLALQRVLLESIGYAVIQKEALDDPYLNTAFITSVLGGFMLAGGLFISSDLLAASFGEPRLLQPLRALSVLVLFDAFATLPMAILRREFQFRSLAMRTFIANVLSGIVGIGMAYAGMGIWSLVGQQITASLGSLIVLWLYSSWRPKWQWSTKDFKSLCVFGGPMVGNALFMVLVNRMDILILSAAAGATVTGLYSLAKRIVRTVTDLIISGVVNVSLSSLSVLKDEPEKRDVFLKEKIALTSFVAYPLFFLLALFSPVVIPLFIGRQWLDSIPIIQLLCGFGLLQLLILYGTNVLISSGLSKTLFYFNAIGTIFLLAFISIGLSWGGVGVALAFFLQAIVSLIGLVIVLHAKLKVRVAVFVVPTIVPILCSTLMSAIVLLFFYLVNLDPIGRILYGGIMAGVSYLLFSYIFARGQVLSVVGFFSKRIFAEK